MSSSIKIIPEINGLRAIAVFFVLIAHWMEIESYQFGATGVGVFFAISGFLITYILLGYRDTINLNKSSIWECCKIFYYRRFLRIFPVYYAFLILCFFLTANYDKINYIWFFSYVSNFHFAIHNWYNLDGILGFHIDLTHTWSLSVEEQFYVFWPVIIFITPFKKIIHVIITLILIGIITHLFYNYLPRLNVVGIITPFYFDDFGLGALTAFLIKNNVLKFNSNKFLGYLILILIPIHFLLSYFNSSFYLLSVSLLTCTFILFFILCKKNMLNIFLNNRVLSYCGKISYGIYLFHMIVWDFVNFVMAKVLCVTTVPKLISFPLSLLLVLLISHISWTYFESPILKFKSKIQLSSIQQL